MCSTPCLDRRSTLSLVSPASFDFPEESVSCKTSDICLLRVSESSDDDNAERAPVLDVLVQSMQFLCSRLSVQPMQLSRIRMVRPWDPPQQVGSAALLLRSSDRLLGRHKRSASRLPRPRYLQISIHVLNL